MLRDDVGHDGEPDTAPRDAADVAAALVRTPDPLAFVRRNARPLVRDLDPHFFDAIVSACRDAGFNLNVVHQVGDLYTACALVAAGYGVCFVPAGIQEGRSRAIVLKPLQPRLSHIDCHLAMAYRQEPACELVQLFVQVAKEVSSRYRNLTRYPVSLLKHSRQHG